MSDYVYGHPVEGPIRAIMFAENFEALDEVQRASWTPLPPGCGEGAYRDAEGAWLMPPPPGAPPAPPPPSEYYLSKVTFERRIPDVPWLKIQALKKTVEGYSATWLTDPSKQSLLPLVRGFGLYDATDRINVLDALIPAFLRGLQAAGQIFGSDEDAESMIAMITRPGPLPGEPAA